MSKSDRLKPLFWVASSRKDLKGFPLDVRRTMGFALFQAQGGGMHVNAKPLRGFGGVGVVEVVEDHEGNTFRAVYTAKFAGAVYVLQAFQKKSKKGVKTPKAELDLIRNRLKTAGEQYGKWRAIQKAARDESSA